MQYPATNIRNVCLMGHGGNGKTSLAEAMLFYSKATDRLGKISEGNTVCDFDAEEIKRQISISVSVAPVEWKGCKINLIDTPGYFDFEGEVLQGMSAADCAVIVLSAKNGLHVGTEKSFKFCQQRALPNIFVVTKIDEEHGDFRKVYTSLREKFGMRVCALNYPLTTGSNVAGWVDLLLEKAYKETNGTLTEIPIPPGETEFLTQLKADLNEALAETSEDLMEKFFAEEPFTAEEVSAALKVGISRRALLPVVSCSGVTLDGIAPLLNLLVEDVSAPVPMELPVTALRVFKTVADPFVGKMSFFKVLSGTLTAGMTLYNRRGGQEKIGRVFVPKGKKQTEVPELLAGDIGVLTKLQNTATGDVLCSSSDMEVDVPKIDYPRPCLSMAVLPKNKGEEEKIAQGLQRLKEEDPVFDYHIDSETREQIVSGMGETHLDVIVSKLKNKFGVEVELKAPRIAYREAIRKKIRQQGKHKKQSGGHGQYGDVWIEFEPYEGNDLQFEVNIFGGSVPKNFHPAVEKGLRECCRRGVLAGYPVVGLKATLVDGSYHDVDSSEMAFKTAASIAFKEGLVKASPVILEPVGSLVVTVPDGMMGDVIGDINKRRGQIMGMRPAKDDGYTEVSAEVPMAEMASYAVDLRSMTRGRGTFVLDFLRYQDAPANVAQMVIETAKQAEE